MPVAFIDGEVVPGYGTDETTGKQIMGIIQKKLQINITLMYINIHNII